MLSGYKTYIVSGVLVVLGVLGFLGVNIPGVNLPSDWLLTALNGFGLAALRAGVAKSGSTL